MFLPWRNRATEMFANLGIQSFDEMLRIFVFSFRSRVTAPHDQLMFRLCSAHCSVYSKLWAWWNSLLHIILKDIICPMTLPHVGVFYLLCIHFLNCIVMNYVLYIVLIWTKSLQ